MKDSSVAWIGEIPEDWSVSRIKHCAFIDQEKLSENTDPDYVFKYIDIGSVTEYGGIGDTVEMSFESSPSRARMVVRDGDTIISTVRTYLKAVAYINSLRDHICSTGFCVLSPKDELFPKFGYYLFQSDYVVQRIVSDSVGVNYPAISSTEIGNIKIVLPKFDEQSRIADFLDDKCAEIDALIAAKEKTNTLLKERRQSIIYEAVTKGLDPTVPMKDSGVEWIGEIPEGWTPVRLKYCISRIESGTSVNSEDRPCNEKEKGVLKTSCVYSGIFQAEHNKAVLENEYPRLSCPVQKETVIVSRMNTPGLIGACGYVGRDYPNLFLPDRLWQVSFDTSCHPKYMWYFLSCDYTKSFFASVCNGTSGSMQNIAQDQFGSVVFFKPPYIEQISITNALDNQCTQIDELIIKNEVTIEELKEYRQSLIYEAVTGKIEVHHERRQS